MIIKDKVGNNKIQRENIQISSQEPFDKANNIIEAPGSSRIHRPSHFYLSD